MNSKNIRRQVQPTLRHTRRVWVLFVALLLAWWGLGPSSVFALPPEPIDNDPVGDPDPFVVPTNGFDWSVPSRFGAYANGIVDFHWDAGTASYLQSYVNPSSFMVNFDGCRTADDEVAGTSVMTYTWTLKGETRVNHTCRFAESFPTQGTYNVSVTLNNPDGSVVLDQQGRGNPFTQNVVVKDLLVVSIGDSYASGEGSPDAPQILGNNDIFGQPTQVLALARWEDPRCHRSANASPARAALALEAADPHTSVTYLSFACSGATINRDYYKDQSNFDPYRSPAAENWSKKQGSGILGSYSGIEPPDPAQPQNNQLPSQIDQVVAALTNNGQIATPRRIDALLVSGGGNDIGFSNIASLCALYYTCRDYEVTSADFSGMVPLTTRIQQDLGTLPDRYTALSSAINTRIPMDPNGKVYITEYPDSTRKDDGGYCGQMLDDVIPGWMQPLLALASIFDGGPYPPLPPYQIEGAEVEWAGGTVLPGLNAAVSAAAGAHGWVLVDGIADGTGNLFSGHGYCASDNWIRRASESVPMQGPWVPWNETLVPPGSTETKGTLHPTAAGYQAVGNRIFAKLAANLLPPATTPATPPSLAGATTHALVGANGWLIGHDTVSTCPAGAASCTFAQEVATTDASTAIRGTALRINDMAVDCTTTTVSGVACTRQLVNAQTYNWSFAFTAEGIYRLEFTANARNGTSAKANREVKVDLHDPTAGSALSAPVPASGWYQSPVTVTLTGADGSGSGIQQVQYQLDGATTTAAGNNLSLRLDTDGVHSLTYHVVDFAGRTNAQQSLTVKVDQSAPSSGVAAVPGANAAGWNNANVNVTLSPSDSGGSGVASYIYSATGAQPIASTTIQGATATQLTINTEGVTTLSFAATDVVGNVEPPKSITIKLDKTVPLVQCNAPDGQWHASDVTLACSASDGGSGLASADTNFGLMTSVAPNTETANAATNSRIVCDKAGNCAAQVGPLSGIKVDRKAPGITLSSPTNTTFIINQIVAANYSCADGGSGVATCAGPVANGANIDSATPGVKTFRVNASDAVGNASNQSIGYQISYNICVLYDQTKSYKLGSTIPIKLQVCDAKNTNLSSTGIVVTATGLTQKDNTASSTVADSTSANPDNNFRFDATLGGYIYNLSTKGLQTGTWVLNFTVTGDPLSHAIQFDVR